ncbi:MAG: transcriptional regulator, partial [Lutimonas sp.]
MKTQLDIDMLLKTGSIKDELDYERALIFDRKLRILAKNNLTIKRKRKKLRILIEEYEEVNWSPSSQISQKKLEDNELAEAVAERERKFIQRRKQLIRHKLKSLDLKQQDLGLILGHSSKSYMSELMNGIYPFSLKDLIVINRVLKIELTDLIPTFLSHMDQI